MREKAQEIKILISEFNTICKELDEKITSIKIDEDKWSIKEIIGHLIDSASNNHQRIVRLQIADGLEFPDYNKDDWLRVQNYNLNMNFQSMFKLFLGFNELISTLVENVDEKSLNNKWLFSWDEKSDHITLKDLITHYPIHLKIHLDHLKERLEEVKDYN